jgi:hypothetical protein
LKVSFYVSDEGEYVYDNKGILVPTCVGYNAPGSECDSKKFVCDSSNVDTIHAALVAALSRGDYSHPGCPVGCAPVEGYLHGYLLAQGQNPDELCNLNNAFYKIDPSTLTKYFTCVGTGETYDQCNNQDLVCSGFNSKGFVTYGWPAAQKSALVLALYTYGHVRIMMVMYNLIQLHKVMVHWV